MLTSSHNPKAMMNMDVKRIWISAATACLSLLYTACTGPSVVPRTENTRTPATFNSSLDTINTSMLSWREFFKDPYLIALIDTALENNQELNIVLQEINIASNEVRSR